MFFNKFILKINYYIQFLLSNYNWIRMFQFVLINACYFTKKCLFII